MGSFSSKLMKHNCSNGLKEKDKFKDATAINDSHSPTAEVAGTPINIKKDKLMEENVADNDGGQLLIKQKLMKNLKLDPRSPTDGISRTPIVLKTSDVSNKGCTIFESPLSIYSQNLSDVDTLTDLNTPTEPSANVSGFDRDPDSSYAEDLNIGSGKNKINENSNEMAKTPLRVSSKPSTAEARNILNEILSSTEFEHILSDNKKYKPPESKNLSVHRDCSETKVIEKKKDRLKCRTPLSNITLSSNSPNYMNAIKKPYTRCKILSDAGLENTGSPKIRQVAEWDKDKTVII